MVEASPPLLFRYRGSDLTSEDLVAIRAMISAYYSQGRSYIPRCLCEAWGWRQANAARQGAKRRRVVPSSREARLLTRRALARQRGSKARIRTRRPAIVAAVTECFPTRKYGVAEAAGRPRHK